jgi:hypothetical protein
VHEVQATPTRAATIDVGGWGLGGALGGVGEWGGQCGRVRGRHQHQAGGPTRFPSLPPARCGASRELDRVREFKTDKFFHSSAQKSEAELVVHWRGCGAGTCASSGCVFNSGVLLRPYGHVWHLCVTCIVYYAGAQAATSLACLARRGHCSSLSAHRPRGTR